MGNTLDIDGIRRGKPATFTFNGRTVEGYPGESVAAALLRAGMVATRCTTYRKDPRGYYCGMGVCWECVVEVEGVGTVRGCMQPVTDNLVVQSAVVQKR